MSALTTRSVLRLKSAMLRHPNRAGFVVALVVLAALAGSTAVIALFRHHIDWAVILAAAVVSVACFLGVRIIAGAVKDHL